MKVETICSPRMSHTLNLLKGVALICVCLVLVDLHFLIADNRTSYETTLRDLHTSILEIGLTSKNLREASASWKSASEQEFTSTQSLLTSTTTSLTSMRKFIESTNSSLNGQLFPAAYSIMEKQSNAALQLQKGIQTNLQQSQALLVLGQQDLLSFNSVIQHADQAISDPAIQQTFLSLSKTAVNLQGMTDDGHKITTEGANWVHRELTPVRGTWHVIRGILTEFAGPAAQVATAVK